MSDTQAQWEALASYWIKRCQEGEPNREGMLDQWVLETLGDVSGLKIADLGCGEGRFCRILAEQGPEHILGIDLCEQFIEAAIARKVSDVKYYLIGNMETLDSVEDGSFDVAVSYVSLVDVADLDAVIASSYRVLKPGGRFISVEPHYLFWLAPWLGAEDDPFTVITEYDDHVYRVTGTPVQLIRALLHAGFVVSGIEEAKPDPAFKAVDSRAYHFAHKFPLWQLVEASVLE